MIRAVLDTNIPVVAHFANIVSQNELTNGYTRSKFICKWYTLVSAIINVESSVASEIYQNAKEQCFSLTISPPILAEVDDVLHRPKVMKAHQLSSQELKKAIREIIGVSFVVPGNTKKIISAALEGKADYIVSRDKDLLDLKEYQGIKIITPEKFMGILRGTSYALC